MLYRPFDVREMYYVPWMVDWPRTEAMPHMLAGKNLSIGLTRSVEVGAGFSHIFASRAMIQHHTVSLKEVNYQIPLYLYPGVGKTDGSLFSRWSKGKDGRTPNLDSGFVEQIAAATELRFVSDGRGDLRKAFGPEDVLAYIYAVFHSPGYRERYEAQLKLDFPRVPFPKATSSWRCAACWERERRCRRPLSRVCGISGSSNTTPGAADGWMTASWGTPGRTGSCATRRQRTGWDARTHQRAVAAAR